MLTISNIVIYHHIVPIIDLKGKRSDGKTKAQRTAQAIKAAKTRKMNLAVAYKKIKEIRTTMEEEGERVLLVIHPGLRDEFQLVCHQNHYTLSEGIRQAMHEWSPYRSYVEKKKI